MPGNGSGLRESFGAFEEHHPPHRIADAGGLFEDRALPRVWLEGLAFLDAQRLEHAHVEEIAFLNGVVVDVRGEPGPEFHPMRRKRIDLDTRNGDEPGRFGIGPFTPRVDPQLLDGLHRFRGVSHPLLENPAHHHVVVVQRGPDDVIAGQWKVAGKARTHEKEFPALVAVGSREAHVGDATAARSR